MENKQTDDLRTANPAGMNTLMEITNSMVKKGYIENFSVKNKKLFAPSKEQSFAPNEIEIVNFFRFEGQSNPDDNAILYVIETNNNLKGTLTDAYGIYADVAINDYIREVEDISKHIKK